MVKQVIVIRKDLKMRRGKEIAQGSHASLAWLSNRLRNYLTNNSKPKFNKEETEWLLGPFTKVCLRVETEEELIDVYKNAKSAGLNAELITDSGKTEFGGVPTKTCCAIGPNKALDIDEITGELKLY